MSLKNVKQIMAELGIDQKQPKAAEALVKYLIRQNFPQTDFGLGDLSESDQPDSQTKSSLTPTLLSFPTQLSFDLGESHQIQKSIKKSVS